MVPGNRGCGGKVKVSAATQGSMGAERLSALPQKGDFMAPSPTSPWTARKVYPASCGVQHYAWGDPNFIPALLGVLNPKNIPFAELWIGAHPLLSSRLRLDTKEAGLDELIQVRPDFFLGREVSRKFGQLPYLLKVLAAAKPLSIQVHPTKSQAEAGFSKEEKEGIALEDPGRNYRDTNHKPELVVALTDFYALCGFRPFDQMEKVLAENPELKCFARDFKKEPHSLKLLLENLMAMPQEAFNEAVRPWVQKISKTGEEEILIPEDHRYWVLKAFELFCSKEKYDRGLPLIMFLNLFHLRPGEGLFLGPGTLHAYLQGAAVEVMANSDNVLRCGLTQKHIDPQEVIRITRFEAQKPKVLLPRPTELPQIKRYETEAEEFELLRLDLEGGKALELRTDSSPFFFLVYKVEDNKHIRIISEATDLTFKRGSVFFVAPNASFEILPEAESVLFAARVPI